MPLLRVKALTSRQCSSACSRAWVINPRSRPSRIGCADWSGRYFIRESATLNKASDPNRSFSFIEPNPWPNNCASSVTTSKSLLPTVPPHKASGSSYGGGDFRRSRPVFTNPIHLDVKPPARKRDTATCLRVAGEMIRDNVVCRQLFLRVLALRNRV